MKIRLRTEAPKERWLSLAEENASGGLGSVMGLEVGHAIDRNGLPLHPDVPAREDSPDRLPLGLERHKTLNIPAAIIDLYNAIQPTPP